MPHSAPQRPTAPHISLPAAVPPPQALERRYAEESHRGAPSRRCRFEYAWGLLRSRYNSDVRKGVAMFRGGRGLEGARPNGGGVAGIVGGAERGREPMGEGLGVVGGACRGRGYVARVVGGGGA